MRARVQQRANRQQSPTSNAEQAKSSAGQANSSAKEAPELSPDDAPFGVLLPPPNVTGELHVGHALTVALEDALVRHRRMRGRPTRYLPGLDHAGIATQAVVERQLAAQGESRSGLGRTKFVERVWAWKGDYAERIGRQLRAAGFVCCDFCPFLAPSTLTRLFLNANVIVSHTALRSTGQTNFFRSIKFERALRSMPLCNCLMTGSFCLLEL